MSGCGLIRKRPFWNGNQLNAMVYSELCGVSFAIGRIRQSHEPWQHAWSHKEHRYPGYEGHEEDKKYNFRTQEIVYRLRCPSASGCHNREMNDIFRTKSAHIDISRAKSAHIDLATTLSFYHQLRSKFLGSSLTEESAAELFPQGPTAKPDGCDSEMIDSGDDSDYTFESDQEDEPYEFQLQDDNLSNAEENPRADIGLSDKKCSEVSTDTSPATARCDLYEAIRSASMSTYLASADPGALLAPHETEMEGHSDSASEGDDEEEEEVDAAAAAADDDESQSTASNSSASIDISHDGEHIAGPGCINKRGYSGCLIGADEMKGCNVMQCLMRKDRDWSPEPDDQEFELSGDYFLSGLCGDVPSRDWRAPRYVVDRHYHGDVLYPDEKLRNDARRHLTPMPFHPTCFEVFTRVSQLRLGSVDIEGLATWRRYHSSPLYDDHPRHLAVWRGVWQWWNHVRGDEFLAANPVLMPALPSVFNDAMETDPNFSIRRSAFEERSQDTNPANQHSQASNDPFNALPHETIHQLLSYLPSQAIARLRLVSRAFQHLPISLFRRLFQNEMPYLWEIRDTTSPSLWAIHTASSIQDCTERPFCLAEQLEEEQDHYRQIIQAEMPEVWESYQENHPWLKINPDLFEEEAKREMLRRHRESIPLPKCDAKRMNWYKLYCGIVRRWDELKGLQNRKRIWEDMEEVVRLIEGYHERNEIGG